MSLEAPPENEPAPPPRRPLMQALREAPATAAILAACVVVFLATLIAGGTKDIGTLLWGSTKNITTLLRFGAVWREAVWDGQYWRLATSMFLHIGVLHLFCNAWFGFKMCTAAEGELGSRKFLALYLGSGVAGAAVSVIGHDVVSAGASGALFGLIGWRLVSLRLQVGSWPAFTQNPAIRRELIWIGSWFVLGAFIGFDNYAHGGGMLFGALFSWALGTGAEPRQIRRRRWATAVGVGIVLVAASLRPLPVLHADPIRLRKAIASQRDPAAVMALTDPLLGSPRYRDRALRLRAWALIQLDRDGEAVDAANEVVDAQPRDARARLLRAFALYHGGQYARAEADANEAVNLDPSPWVREARDDLLRQPRR